MRQFHVLLEVLFFQKCFPQMDLAHTFVVHIIAKVIQHKTPPYSI